MFTDCSDRILSLFFNSMLGEVPNTNGCQIAQKQEIKQFSQQKIPNVQKIPPKCS